MSEDESRGPLATRLVQFDGRLLARLGLWTLAAGVAVAVAVLIGRSEPGLRRISQAVASLQGMPPPQVDEAARENAVRDHAEMVRLAENLRQINADRMRLIERLEAIERHLDDITGSINRTSPLPARAEENLLSPPAVTVPVPPAVPSAAPNSADAPAPAQQSAQSPAAQEPVAVETTATGKIEFGVDLGGAQTIDGLRMLWTTAKGRHGTLLEGLRPIITIRENSRPGKIELRLVAGPLASAATAARLCAVITTAGAVCQPAVFDGQRLALR